MGSLTASFAPTHFVDIADSIDIKCEALMSFVSQFSNHDPTPFATRARKKAQEYGVLAGMKYAEPFRLFQVPASSQPDVHLTVTYNPGKVAHGL